MKRLVCNSVVIQSPVTSNRRPQLSDLVLAV